jgi:hypothetical protein
MTKKPTSLSLREHGTILPGLETLAAISRVLEVSLSRLVSGIDNEGDQK